MADRLLKVFLWDRIVARAIHAPPPRLLRDLTTIFLAVVTATVVLGIVFELPLTGLWATSGMVGLVIGFALRNIILDLFTGIAVNIDRPYRIGDWVTVQGRVVDQNITGRIIELNWRTTRIESEEKIVAVIPNSLLSTMVVSNIWGTQHSTRYQNSFRFDFSVPPERVRRILMAAIKSVINEKPGFLPDPPPQVLASDTNEFGVLYLVRYWITPWEHGATPAIATDHVTTSVLHHARQAGISLAYPKQDIFHDQMPLRNLDGVTAEGRVALLRRLDLFASLADDEFDLIAERMRQIAVKEGDEVIAVGSPSSEMFILVEGLLEVCSYRTGEPQRVAQITPGQCLGEMSLFTGKPRTSSVIALTGAVLYEISKEDLNELFTRSPRVMESVSAVIAERLEEREGRMARDAAAGHANLGPSPSKQQALAKLRSIFRRA